MRRSFELGKNNSCLTNDLVWTSTKSGGRKKCVTTPDKPENLGHLAKSEY